MKKSYSLIIVVILVALVGFSLIPSPQVTARTTDVEVLIDEGFQPSNVIIQPGTTVIWRNKEHASHSVLSLSGVFSSGPFRHNEFFSYTFVSPGTYEYRDEFSNSTGTVIVLGQVVSPSVSVSSPLNMALPPNSGQLPDTATVSIGDNYFAPAALTVAVGATVTWTNNGDKPHSATSVSSLFDSGVLNRGQSFSFTFQAAGTFAYTCIFHNGQSGSVTVIGGGTVSTSPALSAPPPPALQPPPAPQAAARSQPPAAATPETRAVQIGDNTYNPVVLAASTGAKVTWTNNGKLPHTVTSDTGLFDSGMLIPGQSFSYTFQSAGAYAYHCIFHTGQAGTVTVIEGAAPVSASTAASLPDSGAIFNKTSPKSQAVLVSTPKEEARAGLASSLLPARAKPADLSALGLALSFAMPALTLLALSPAFFPRPKNLG